MAGVKWIKLMVDVFDNQKIRQIESMPEGDGIIVVWFYILCLAGNINDGGAIYLTREVPYTDEMLATFMRRPLNLVKMALTVFERFKMIEVVDEVICISNWAKYQNVAGMERVREQTRTRVAAYREREKQKLGITGGETCQYCGAKAEGIDHIIPRTRGGKDIQDNVVSCCEFCNSSKQDKDLVDFLNYNFHRLNHNIIKENSNLSALVRLQPDGKRYVTLHNATVTQGERYSNATDIEEELDREGEVEQDGDTREYGAGAPTPTLAPKKAKPVRHKYGEYGWVMLTQEQHACLLTDLGAEELSRCIAYIDESAQSNGNKNKWRDWNLVIRRCSREGWGRSATPVKANKPDTLGVLNRMLEYGS